jgi:SpoVK/Ycf46/Vps4 family AAA+-type ATPase
MYIIYKNILKYNIYRGQVIMKFLQGGSTIMSENFSTEVVSKMSEEIQLSDYLRAGYSFIHVRTQEDERARSYILRSKKQVVPEGDIRYMEWTSTQGLVEQDGSGEWTSTEHTSIIQALDHMESTQEQAMIMVFYNVRQFMQTPQVVQKFKDVSRIANMIGSHIILVGPYFEFPIEISSDITIYDLDLPTMPEFRSDFGALVKTYSSNINSYTEEDIDRAASSAVGMTKLQGENAISLTITKAKAVDFTIVQKEKEQVIKRSDVLDFIPVIEDMSTLGGFSNLKEWIYKRKDAFSPEARSFGIKNMKGILLVGFPGTGKTHASVTIAHYLKVPLLKFDLGKVFRGIQGGSEAAIRTALKTVEAVAPCALLLDEVEKMTAGSQSSGQTDSGTTARVMGTLLSWMSDMDKDIFIIATANNPQTLPAELMRKGRFSEIWGVMEPNKEEREEIWKIHTQKVRPDLVFDWAKLAKYSEGFVGAEIEALVEDSLFNAFSSGMRELEDQDFLDSITTMIPQSKTNKEKIDDLKKWMVNKVRFVGEMEQTVSVTAWGGVKPKRELKIL